METHDSDIGSVLRQMLRDIRDMDPEPIGAMFRFELEMCDPKEGAYVFRCRTLPWMTNTAGVLHGGMGAAIMDQAMSFVARAVKPAQAATMTVQLQVEHHRPIDPGEKLRVFVNTVSMGHTLMNFRCEVFREEHMDRPCLSGSGIFYNKH